ncbi:myosin 1 ASCRUDRAFT_82281 [Ascoidea rubescens DSM 1968]|uniref:Uncharacterized protein n=1 Tax=Ascoidea rubescens DSM 1968 TaxID=1344418 RepID=A0A1D2VCR4_9ASCO|nr:hypothetical protein ASCRUDRAFT_82281 [Ascoidea rubescens DSM 1968]ODV59257.1 hypothetical protein ASCRUDRAFT_82281 [Ascoidea rubescens DSM 1968]
MTTNNEDIEFDSHQWVWLPDPKLTFVKGFVTEKLENDKIKVRCSDDADRIVDSSITQKVNPPKFNKADDMAELTYLNEPSVLNNLDKRYKDDLIYTYSGLFLVAINPYLNIPIYGPDYINIYNNGHSDSTTKDVKAKPHIFAITDLTYRYMLQKKQNQSILVTGESGAGKTENTKKIIQYLASITLTNNNNPLKQNPSNLSISSSFPTSNQFTTFEEQIIQANPILESFGNAQTVRNNNSSRFGKFIRIEFADDGKISGANIDWYLLEKSRVINQSPQERNYHIFYQLLLGLSKIEKEKLFLNIDIRSFNYLKKGNYTIPNVDDKKEFKNLLYAFQVMGFDKNDYWEIFKTIAIILLIGNIDFISQKSEQANFSKDSPIDNIANLLGISSSDFTTAILRPKVKAGREFVTQSRNASQAKFSLDALSKSLYERTFKFIVDQINDKLDHSLNSSNFIGVLDIAGFEIFKKNSFEQLCINYTNEKLQQFFNHHMFVLEQNEYIKENINWRFIDYGHDLQGTIDLIESAQNPIGIFSILDEECIVPKASDLSFIQKLNKVLDHKSDKFTKGKFSDGFILKHYAANVEYSTEGWLDKNRDPLNENVVELMTNSANNHMVSLFNNDISSNSTKNSLTKKGMFRTVAQRHKEQLNNLMNQLSDTYPHFVRCIIPNNKKRAHDFDKKLILEQLRCNGVLEGIRIARAGYPNRIFFKEFFQRYEILSKKLYLLSSDMKKNCELILSAIHLDSALYNVGLTKVFFKAGVLADLESKREDKIKYIFTDFQAVARGCIKRRLIKYRIEKIQASQVLMKNLLVYNELKKNPWYDLLIKLKPLLSSSKQQQEKQLYNEQIKNLKNQLTKIEKEKTTTRKSFQELQKEYAKIEDVLATERDLSTSKENLLQKTKKKEIELTTELEEKTKELNKLRTSYESYSKNKNTLESKVENWKKEVTDQKKTIAVLEKDKNKMKMKQNAMEKELRNLKDNTTTSTRNFAIIKDEVAELKAKIRQKDSLIRDLEFQLRNANKDLEKKFASPSRELEKANQKISQLMEENSFLTNKIKSIDQPVIELDSLKKQVAELNLTIEKLETEKNDLDNNYKSADKNIEALKLQYKNLEREATEAKNLLKVKIADDIKFERGRQKHNSELMELKHKIKEAESCLKTEKENTADLTSKLNSITREYDSLAQEKKEFDRKITELNAKFDLRAKTYSNDDYEQLKAAQKKLIDEFASVKLQLNEQSALVRKGSLENSKMTDEMKVLKTRLASEAFDNQKLTAQLEKIKLSGGNIDSSILNNQSSDTDYAKIQTLLRENRDLKQSLELEKKASKRAELELQKQATSLNSEIASRGLSMLNNQISLPQVPVDSAYKVKYENSEARVKLLERQMKEVSGRRLPPLPLKDNQNIINQQESSNSELIKVYQDVSKQLRTTREELAKSKQEISRLKKSAEAPANKYFNEKKSKTETTTFLLKEELITTQLKLEASQNKVEDLEKSIKLFKSRSEDYFSKLEEAETIVKACHRSEKYARDELKEAQEMLTALKSNTKDVDAVKAKLHIKIYKLEAEVGNKQAEIEKLLNNQTTLTNELERYRYLYITGNKYNNRDKQLEDLNQKLAQSLVTETTLQKEIKRLQLQLDNSLGEKQILDDQLNKWESDKVYYENLIQQISEISSQFQSYLTENQNMGDANSEILELRSSSSMNKEKLNKEKQNVQMVLQENIALEKYIKQLQSRVKNLQRDSISSNDTFWRNRMEELEKKMGEINEIKFESSKSSRALETTIKDLQTQLELESHSLQKVREEKKTNEEKISRLIQKLEELQKRDEKSQLLLKRAEREINSKKENSLRLEKELLDWKAKFELVLQKKSKAGRAFSSLYRSSSRSNSSLNTNNN